jgi:chemotaxis protein methyltransferase WspC
MTLLDSGLPPERFVIEAWDISRPALAKAERGIYGRNSFRSENLGFRDRYFRQVAEGYQVVDAVRRQVRFRHENMLSPGPCLNGELHHVVFCRNVLIYFDRPTQEQALSVLQRLLAADGILFVGPAETFLMRGSGFTPDSAPMSFAFRPKGVTRPATVAAKPIAPGFKPRPKPLTKTPSNLPGKLSVSPPARPAPAAPKPAPAPALADLDTARQLANSGRMPEAAQACEAFLRTQSESVEGHYLLGLVYDALGDSARATQSYRKAIYLDPGHSEALVHLALLAERRGDEPEARRLYERARRVAK